MEAIWNANPLVTKLYCFEDGNCFIKHSDAMSWKKETQKDFVLVERNPKQVQSENTEEVKEVKTKKSNK